MCVVKLAYHFGPRYEECARDVADPSFVPHPSPYLRRISTSDGVERVLPIVRATINQNYKMGPFWLLIRLVFSRGKFAR